VYIVESIRGYIKKPTFIFDKTCDFMKDAFRFKNKKDLNKFFMFRDRKRYKTYKVGDKQ